jgi:hypothetical protein
MRFTPGVETLVDLPAGLVHVGRAHAGEPALAAERHRPNREDRNPKAAPAERAILHGPTFQSPDIDEHPRLVDPQR